ncbi:hypothetical protein O181_032737 [Austropuccinia psidii MF-1]|uniref:Uncharacterized protein n=1 Tax=Austropuccinia psidii MF-1 TaxID=1389203 RepID=A0A9Q3D371_9BASI|nr:hypothetical protein [Austropuccinia psidii MF-1]
MAQSMMMPSKMPKRFWRISCINICLTLDDYTICHTSNFLASLLQSQLYPFGMEAIVHIPAVQKHHKLAPRGVACFLLKPLMSGGLSLWDLESNRLTQSVRIVFPRFQSLGTSDASHIISAETLGQVPTECYFKDESREIDSLPVTKDLDIPEHLGQALSGLL